MRPDGKPEGLRQSMSWVHTYTGLLLGWLLYAVFFTGTFSYFRSEVNDWMRPELHRTVYSEQSVERVLDILAARAPEASSWTLSLPGPRRISMDASWRGANDPAGGRGGGNRMTVDPDTGEQLTPRRTSASNFFYRFHYQLHWFSSQNGRMIVGFATMLMFIAIISGVITHKKIFSDFFTFRPKKGQRSWLDAHNATAVLALPFHLIITFSGLILIANTLTPNWTFQGLTGTGGGGGGRGGAAMAPANQGGPGGRQVNQTGTANQGGQGDQGAQRGAAPGGRGGNQAERGNFGGGQTGNSAGGRPGGAGNAAPPATAVAAAPLEKAPLASVLTMLRQANEHWPIYGVGSLTVNAPNTVQATVVFNERYSHSLLSGGRGGGRTMRFNGVTGELLEATEIQPSTASVVRKIRNAIVAIHEGRFAGEVTRWLLFLSGILGTFMAASGMVLWVVKRLPERKKLGRTPIPHRIVELLNVGAIAGLSIAMASLFWSNRLLPADMPDRGAWEINIFFITWLVCLLHPLLCSHRTAWLQQMVLAALLYGLLPVLNALTGGASLLHTIANGQWSVANVDLILLSMAAIHGSIVWWLLKKPVAKAVSKAAPGATKTAPTGAKPPPKAAPKAAPKAPPKAPPKLPPKPAPVAGGLVPTMAKTAAPMTAATAASLVPAAAMVSTLVDAAAPILEHTS